MKKILKIFFGPSKRRIRRKINIQRVPIGFTIKEYQKKKKEFLEIAEDRMIFFNQFYNLEYKNISIRNQKTRWGSCSSKNNLNLNYRIFLLSDEMRDYVIVHELCHLKEMNHSRNFWNLVQEQIPNYKNIRKEMKQYYFIDRK